MRLWHTTLIPVLPRQQLLGQWRELNSIFKLKNQHILINFVYGYPKEHLYSYSLKVIEEMQKREYKINFTNFWEYFFPVHAVPFDMVKNPFPEKMTNRYLLQCYYNLQEKYDCGAITKDDWEKIDKLILQGE